MNKLLALVLLILLPSIAFAAAPAAPSASLVANYPDLFAWLFGIVSLAAVTLLGSMIHTGNKNNKIHWEHTNKNTTEISTVKVDLAHLKGQHEINHPDFRRRHEDSD